MRRFRRRMALLLGAAVLSIRAAGAGAAESCPFDFRSTMPAGSFCVYQGTVHDADGSLCAEDVVVLWSSYAPDSVRGGADTGRTIFVGFVSWPDVVLRAVAAPRQSARARLVELARGDLAVPLAGEATLAEKAASGANATLTLTVRSSPESESSDDCKFVSYRGRFLGLMARP